MDIFRLYGVIFAYSFYYLGYRILTSMDEMEPDLAQEIRNLRFTFEDILKVDDNGIQMSMKGINQEGLLVALKTPTDDLKAKAVFKSQVQQLVIF